MFVRCLLVFQVAICHNEDTYPLVKTDGYFVSAHIVDTAYDSQGNPYKVEQQFTHFTYPGLLPGQAFGINSHGVVQTVNALYPELVLRNRTGRYVSCDAIMHVRVAVKAKNCNV